MDCLLKILLASSVFGLQTSRDLQLRGQFADFTRFPFPKVVQR